jgi:hypothetical protein
MALALRGPDKQRLATLFDELAKGGKVKMPLGKPSWGDGNEVGGWRRQLDRADSGAQGVARLAISAVLGVAEEDGQGVKHERAERRELKNGSPSERGRQDNAGDQRHDDDWIQPREEEHRCL